MGLKDGSEFQVECKAQAGTEAEKHKICLGNSRLSFSFLAVVSEERVKAIKIAGCNEQKVTIRKFTLELYQDKNEDQWTCGDWNEKVRNEGPYPHFSQGPQSRVFLPGSLCMSISFSSLLNQFI